MKDIIQQAELDNPQSALEALIWPPLSYMYLEKVVSSWLSSPTSQAPCLTRFDSHTNLSDWQRGRIFCADCELRWEKLGDKFQAVYIGQPVTLPNFKSGNIDLTQTNCQEESYYLWGRRVAENDLEKIGVKTKPPGMGLFIEMRVAQRLQYPIQDNKTQRVKLKVCHYCHKETGQIIYHRYYGLEEVA